MKKREEDRKLMEDRVLDNVKTMVLPYLIKAKKSKLNEKVKFQLQIIESALEEVVSPFVNTLSTRYLKLTPTEIQVATLIKEGNRTKDIAFMMGVSPSTIDTHRNKVRKKLGIVNKRENLRTRLLTLQ
ncbi:MAG TPA: LuxR family transcriptional regulator [Desulfobacterales bacterium]|nr:LuxR family transcriptional regulator [Desulfobacterales bacterium]